MEKFDDATPTPLDRSPSKFAGVIMSWISIGVRNFIEIASGISSPRMRDFAHHLFSWLFFVFFGGYFHLPTDETAERILAHNTPKDAFPRKDVPFGVRKTVLNI